MDVELRDTIEKEVHSAVLSTQNQLLNSLTSLIDAKLDGFQRNIQENQKVLSESQLAKIDENITDTFKFKKMGNEEQYKHNQKVFAKMREIRNQVETGNVSQENISEARKKIVEGMDLIKNRQKLIKLADS